MSALVMGLSFTANSQCTISTVVPTCTNPALAQPTVIDVSALVCDGSTSGSFELSAGGLYTVTISAGKSYSFTLTPSGNNTSDPIFPGVMDLFHDAAQAMPAATSGPIAATSGMTPNTMSYTDDNAHDETLYLSIMDKACSGNWKDYTVSITCTSCEITCPSRQVIAANESGCVSAASVFIAPTLAGPCDNASLQISDADGTGATLSGSVVTLPAGISADIYTIEFTVENCSGMVSTCSTELVVEPSSSCNSTNITLSSVCETTISPSDILANKCAADDQYTIYIDGVQTNTVTEARVYPVEVRYTPTDATGAPNTANPFYNKVLCWNNINVEDKTGPECTLAAADLEYNFVCGFAGTTATPTFTDCSGDDNITINPVVETTYGKCGFIDGVTTDTNNDLFDDFVNGVIVINGVTIPAPTSASAFTSPVTGSSFCLENIITRVYTATDANGMLGESCTQFIYIWRPKTILSPVDALLECGTNTSVSTLVGFDPQYVPHFANPMYNATNDTSTANDFATNSIVDSTFVATKVDDNGNLEFIEILDHSVCQFIVESNDRLLEDQCGSTIKFIRSWEVYDCCTDTFITLTDPDQWIKTEDTQVPTITNCPSDMESGAINNPVELILDANCSAAFNSSSMTLLAQDDCGNITGFEVEYFSVDADFMSNQTSVGTGESFTFAQKGNYIAQVVAVDECGLKSESCNIHIEVKDTTSPAIFTDHIKVTLNNSGMATICADSIASATDNCGVVSSVTIKNANNATSDFTDCISISCDDLMITDSSAIIMVSIAAEDNCGNINISTCPLTIEINTTPSILCPDDVSVECGIYNSGTLYGTPNIFGVCDTMFAFVFEDTDLVTGVCSGTGSVTRTFTVIELNGDPITPAITCAQVITIEDTTGPTFDNAPADVTFECDVTIPDGSDVTASDACNSATVTITNVMTAGSCADNFTIARTFTATDDCGNMTSYTQTITVEDTTAPTFDNPPADITVQCNAVPDGSDVTASDVCNTATVMIDDLRTDGPDCMDTYTIARTFTATDVCGNVATFTQMLSVEDTTPPIFLNTPDAMLVVACNNIPDAEVVAAIDNCDAMVEITVTDGDPIVDNNCPNDNSFVRTFTATDNCGNATIVNQMITVQPQLITVTPAPNDTLDCMDIDSYTFTAPTVVDSPCESTNPVVTGPVIARDTLDNGDVRLIGTFTVTDDCGITAEVSTTAIFEDCCSILEFQSGIQCFGGDDTANITVRLTDATFLNFMISDLTFKAVDLANPGDTIVSIGDATFEVPKDDDSVSFEIFVCPNDETVIVCLPIIDTVSCTTTRIAGRIFNEEFTPLEEVEVELMNTEIPMSMTNDDGEYSFDDLADQGYTISAHKDNDPLNGISTFDLVVMAQHVLGITSLDSPYKMIAADVNMDEQIDVFDMIELRQLILYTIKDFTINTSWRFVNADYVFPDAQNPWLETIPESQGLEALRSEVEVNFVAVKIGDLDCSAQTRNFASDVTPRQNKTLVFQTENQEVEAGTTFDVVLQPSQDIALSAMQFTLDFDPNMASLTSLNSEALGLKEGAVNQKFATEGLVPFAWYTHEEVALNTEDALTMTFTAKQDFDMSSFLELNSELTSAAAYTSAGIEYDLSLQVVAGNEINISNDFILYQNQPNPFKEETVIAYEVAHAQAVTLTVFDLDGKLLYTQNVNASAGYNKLILAKEDIQNTGVLFYQIDAANYTMTKKMIILD